MKTFTYTIQDEVGIHARPAGLLAKKAKEFKSTITLEKGGKSGDTVTVSVDGADEETAFAEMQAFFQQNL